MNKSKFQEYTPQHIGKLMSLRTPQQKSLEILADIMSLANPRKGMDMAAALDAVRAQYPTCGSFERGFMSLAFALATGVGKTRLMGAFIAYLYTRHGIRNFFVVAPNMTIYEKLKRDLADSNEGNQKYVFRGLGCFAVQPPKIITDDDYKSKQLSFTESDVRIFVYNIDKFNKENAGMRDRVETLGDSFYKHLSTLPDLVLIMDESHHYRAAAGAAALDELQPLLGLELTATPLVAKGSKQIPFKNVVYEYPLSKAIADGYTRTPFAVTRPDIKFYNFGDEQLDKLMLQDGIGWHEHAKRRLAVYAANHGRRTVKPFMLVVCKDTEHAAWVEAYIRSDNFRDGAYRNKTIVVHSKQKGAETEANTRLLLGVESADNPVEIVIHVNMLKEGWDVNNLYTIVPLRTAASKILREQMVGRGLRLPYGERTGDDDVDVVRLTAHDKFEEILKEAQKGDSIFKKENVISVPTPAPERTAPVQLALDNMEPDKVRRSAYTRTKIRQSAQTDAAIDRAAAHIREEVTRTIQSAPGHTVTPQAAREIAADVVAALAADKDLGAVFRENAMPLEAWAQHHTEQVHIEAQKKFIPIPRIKVTDAGVEEYRFTDFDLDLSAFNHTPVTNAMLLQNLVNVEERQRVTAEAIDFDGYNPARAIVGELRKKPEIDYERCSALLQKLIGQVCAHYTSRHGDNGMRNIAMMYKKDIAEGLYKQMMQHFYCTNGFLQEEVADVRGYNLCPSYTWQQEAGLFEPFTEDVRSVLFTGIRKGVFSTAKFDSKAGELTLAQVLERDSDVLNWLRPAPQEFNITYNRGKAYEPDFVAETAEAIYLVEVKAERDALDADVLAKKERAVQYCGVASRWSRANGGKEWRHLFIPAEQIGASTTFAFLAQRFVVQ